MLEEMFEFSALVSVPPFRARVPLSMLLFGALNLMFPERVKVSLIDKEPLPEPSSSIVVSSGISKEFSTLKRTPEAMSSRDEAGCEKVSIIELLFTLNFPVVNASAISTFETLIPFKANSLSGSLSVISFVFSNLPPPDKVKVNAPTFGVSPEYFRVLSVITLIAESARCVILAMM